MPAITAFSVDPIFFPFVGLMFLRASSKSFASKSPLGLLLVESNEDIVLDLLEANNGGENPADRVTMTSVTNNTHNLNMVQLHALTAGNKEVGFFTGRCK